MLLRRLFVSFTLFCIFFAIGYLFWSQEIKYLQPTPRPDHYSPPPILSKINSPTLQLQDNKPLFIHFFNPECPCSRFNIKHFNTLVRHYKDKTQFRVVIPEGADKNKAIEILPQGVSITEDTNKELATAFGVYSTPQAVILNTESKLYFRGNYNKARYCTQKNSNYAELALIDLLSNLPPKDYGTLATTAYGCEFNKDIKY